MTEEERNLKEAVERIFADASIKGDALRGTPESFEARLKALLENEDMMSAISSRSVALCEVFNGAYMHAMLNGLASGGEDRKKAVSLPMPSWLGKFDEGDPMIELAAQVGMDGVRAAVFDLLSHGSGINNPEADAAREEARAAVDRLRECPFLMARSEPGQEVVAEEVLNAGVGGEIEPEDLAEGLREAERLRGMIQEATTKSLCRDKDSMIELLSEIAKLIQEMPDATEAAEAEKEDEEDGSE
jgi:hypothetical protein